MNSDRSFISSFGNKIKKYLKLILSGRFSVVWGEFSRRLYSTSFVLGLRRNLQQDFTPRGAKVDISVRLIKEGDADIILNHNHSLTELAEKRKKLVNANIPDCYVAVANNTPCFMQWLIGPKQNKHIQDHFGNLFPELEKDEALLTSAFANPDFRGMGIMPEAMSKITTKATELGVQWVITFVDLNNIPSLKGCKRAGFSPYILKKDQWFLFKRYVSFEVIPDDMLAGYQEATGGRRKKTPIKAKMVST